jgi:hypothetical protein
LQNNENENENVRKNQQLHTNSTFFYNRKHDKLYLVLRISLQNARNKKRSKKNKLKEKCEDNLINLKTYEQLN